MSSKVSILGLKLPTDPRWVNLAAISLEEILTDHAFCEQKAATSAISLIQRYPERARLVDELAPIVTEEWGHFRQVLAEMKKRGFALGKQRKDLYVNELMNFQQRGGAPDAVLLDRLLQFALIEARSAERFRLLSEGLEDAYLKEFYRKFMISEAGHYRLFIDLANEYLPEERVRQRWTEWLEFEADMIAKLPVRGDRMH
ncbi:tRNA-(ms[2]io[6]A)-hydroxylase [Chitinophaga pollutisoli]|uniref:tRNA-(Ms[2]io[6]A)-hydroxylase n=1 Tax=Chitinophaga pollutisoli TaxID=3133966 RepID=A0ABZ2YNB2_9BACT